MKSPGTQIPENMNWADYCDALRAEPWLRLQNELRPERRRRIEVAEGGNRSILQETDLERRKDR